MDIGIDGMNVVERFSGTARRLATKNQERNLEFCGEIFFQTGRQCFAECARAAGKVDDDNQEVNGRGLHTLYEVGASAATMGSLCGTLCDCSTRCLINFAGFPATIVQGAT